MLNIEKYKDEIKDQIGKISFEDAIIDTALKHIGGCGDISQKDLFDWLCSEYKEPLLDGEEKEFLQDLMKWYGFNVLKRDGLKIAMYERMSNGVSDFIGKFSVPFDTDQGLYKFQNLEDDKMYTLEELGI